MVQYVLGMNWYLYMMLCMYKIFGIFVKYVLGFFSPIVI